jgi:hypothetical protein
LLIRPFWKNVAILLFPPNHIQKDAYIAAFRIQNGNGQSRSISRCTARSRTLLDCARYFHKSAGSTGLLRLSKTSELRPTPINLPRPPRSTKTPPFAGLDACLIRLVTGQRPMHSNPTSKRAKTSLFLDPYVKPLIASLAEKGSHRARWMLIINEPVEADF